MSAPTASRVLDVARSQLGYLEPGWNDAPGTQVTKFGAWYAAWSGLSGYRDTAWCAMFVSWCLATAGFKPEEAGRYGNCRPYIAWFKAHGMWGSTPRVGAVVFYDWDGGGADHVGFVEAVRADGRIVTVEGNASTPGVRDGVKRLVRKSSIVGYGYPPYASEASPGGGGGGGSAPATSSNRRGYPTLYRGSGGAEDTGDARWWVAQWFRLMATHSPGYYKQIVATPGGRREIDALEIGDATLTVTARMAREALGDNFGWTGAITQQIWAIYPPVT
jgi:hypothetical protein